MYNVIYNKIMFLLLHVTQNYLIDFIMELIILICFIMFQRCTRTIINNSARTGNKADCGSMTFLAFSVVVSDILICFSDSNIWCWGSGSTWNKSRKNFLLQVSKKKKKIKTDIILIYLPDYMGKTFVCKMFLHGNGNFPTVNTQTCIHQMLSKRTKSRLLSMWRISNTQQCNMTAFDYTTRSY